MTEQTGLNEFTPEPEPIHGVYRADPDGLECADCGDVVEALWLADVPGGDRYVCESCKEW